MRVTEKGQVTIPKPIRDKLGIGPGSEVEFVDEGNVVSLRRSQLAGDDPAAALLQHIERNVGSFDFEGKQADDVMRFLRD